MLTENGRRDIIQIVQKFELEKEVSSWHSIITSYEEESWRFLTLSRTSQVQWDGRSAHYH